MKVVAPIDVCFQAHSRMMMTMMMQQHPYHPVLQVSKLNAACSTDIFRIERKVCDVCTFVRLDIKDDKNKTEYALHFYNTACEV